MSHRGSRWRVGWCLGTPAKPGRNARPGGRGRGGAVGGDRENEDAASGKIRQVEPLDAVVTRRDATGDAARLRGAGGADAAVAGWPAGRCRPGSGSPSRRTCTSSAPSRAASTRETTPVMKVSSSASSPARPGRDRDAVRGVRRVPEHLDQPALDPLAHHVLPAAGLLVDVLVVEADDVDEQALGRAVLAHDRRGLGAARGVSSRWRSPDTTTRPSHSIRATVSRHHRPALAAAAQRSGRAG